MTFLGGWGEMKALLQLRDKLRIAVHLNKKEKKSQK